MMSEKGSVELCVSQDQGSIEQSISKKQRSVSAPL